MSSPTDRLRNYEFPPRRGPEWGSGGIFGLKYHNGVLFFDLAFEAQAHFQRTDGETVYPFDLVGGGPRSGGDTYNAVETLDDEIFFGGWVHAPAVYEGRAGKGGRILFTNKFSHLHSYDIREDKVRLLWSDTAAHQTEWAGEVSEIVYDPVGDRLIIGRADGSRNLGIYSVDRRQGRAERISELPGLKGALYLDHACFDVRRNWQSGVDAIQTIDLVTGKHSATGVDYATISVDGGGVKWPSPGCAVSAYSRFFLFVRGGLLVGDPLGDLEGMSFVRLFDFGTGYSPSRTMCKVVVGGVLVAFNAYSNAFIHPRNDFESDAKEYANFISGPSVLLYVTPPQARVVSALGARITGFEKIGEKLLVASSSAANLGADDATPMDTGHRDLSVFGLGQTLLSSPSVAFSTTGKRVANDHWGGVPLDGHRRSSLTVDGGGENRLTVFEYDLGLPVRRARSESFALAPGRQAVDLSSFHGVVSFKFEKADTSSTIRIDLA